MFFLATDVVFPPELLGVFLTQELVTWYHAGMNEQEVIQIKPAEVKSRFSNEFARAYMNKVYGWMAFSLLIATGIAIFCTRSQELYLFAVSHWLLLSLVGLGIVVVMSFGREKLSARTLGVLLIAFSVLEGLTLGPILSCYTQQSLTLTFACTGGTFGVMALYGACTKRDLSPIGSALLMILIGLIICLIVNVFWKNDTFDIVISIVGVLTFSILTAYDTQMLLRQGAAMRDEEGRAKGAVLGALSLYLDFINLFLYLLRFLGDRR